MLRSEIKEQGNNENKYGQKSLAKMYLSVNAYRSTVCGRIPCGFFTKIVNLHSINSVFGWVLVLLLQCVRRRVHIFLRIEPSNQQVKSGQAKSIY